MYMNQDKKKFLSDTLKVAMKQFPNVKYSLSVEHHSKIVCTIKQGDKCLDPYNKGHISVNHYYIDDYYSPDAAKILNTIKDCLNTGNYDKSDIQSDYFDCGWYIGIHIGSYNKPFIGV